MYDSRTDKARTPQSDSAKRKVQFKRDEDAYDALSLKQQVGPTIAEFLDDDEPAVLAKPVDQFEIDLAHAEALEMHIRWYEDRLDEEKDYYGWDLAPWEAEAAIGGVPEDTTLAYSSVMSDFDQEVWEARNALEREDQRERDAQYDGAYGGYSNDSYEEDGYLVVDCWLPFMRIEELRETFGRNWLGNGFHIVQGNGVRR